MLAQPSMTPYTVPTPLESAPTAFGYPIPPHSGHGTSEELHDLRQRYSSLLIHMDRLRPQLASVDVLYRPEEPNEWSIKEILGHIIDTDRDIWWPRIQAILESNSPSFVDVDPDELVRKHSWQSIPLEDIFAQLMRVRWNYAMQLAQIPLAAFNRTGEHPMYGSLTPFQILSILIAHDAHYVAKIQSLIETTS